jgi:integrase
MPPDRPLPMYTQRKTAKGRTYYYFRWKDVYRRLPDNPASEAFRAEYARALASISPENETRIISGSVRALLRDYKGTPEWLALAPKTKADYARVLDHLRPIGNFQANNVRRQHVIGLRNKLTNRRTQDLFVAAVSRMFGIGMDLGYTDRNPAARIGRLNEPESFAPWPLAARQKFEASDAPDWMRTAYMLALWTGQREGDVLRLSRARFDGGGFVIRQGRPEAKRGKGRKGRVVTLYVPAAAPLRAYLATCSFPGLLFVTDAKGRAIKADTLRKELRTHLDKLGLRDLRFHGLRHTTAAALAEAGASSHEIMAITGHQTEQMVKLYTKGAEQKRLATSAIRKLDGSGDEP